MFEKDIICPLHSGSTGALFDLESAQKIYINSMKNNNAKTAINVKNGFQTNAFKNIILRFIFNIL